MKKLVSILMILAMIIPLAGAQSTDIFKKKKKKKRKCHTLSTQRRKIDGHLQEKEEKEEQDGSGG